MKTYTFSAYYRATLGGFPARVRSEGKHRIHGSFEHFLASQQTQAGRLGFLSDLACEHDVEPISLSVELCGVPVPIYDLS